MSFQPIKTTINPRVFNESFGLSEAESSEEEELYEEDEEDNEELDFNILEEEEEETDSTDEEDEKDENDEKEPLSFVSSIDIDLFESSETENEEITEVIESEEALGLEDLFDPEIENDAFSKNLNLLEEQQTEFNENLDIPEGVQADLIEEAENNVEEDIVISDASNNKKADLIQSKVKEIRLANEKLEKEANFSEKKLIEEINVKDHLDPKDNQYVESFLKSIDSTYTTKQEYLDEINRLKEEIENLEQYEDDDSIKQVNELKERLISLENSYDESEESKKSIFGVIGPVIASGAINFLKEVMGEIWAEFRKNLDQAWKEFYSLYIETIPAIWSIVSMPVKKAIQKISDGVTSIIRLGLQMIKGIGTSLSSLLGWFTSFGASLSSSASSYLRKLYADGDSKLWTGIRGTAKFVRGGLGFLGQVVIWTVKFPIVLINGVWQVIKNPLGQLLLATIQGYQKLLIEQPFLLKIILDYVMVGRDLACEKISNMMWEATYVETPETLQKTIGSTIERASDIAGQTIDYGSWIAWEGARSVFNGGTFSDKMAGVKSTMQSSVTDSIDSLLGGVQGSAIAAGSAGIGSVGLSLLKNGTGFFIGTTMDAAEKAIGVGFDVMHKKALFEYNINYWRDFFMKDCLYPRTYELSIEVDSYFDWFGFGEGPNPVPKTQRQMNIERAIKYRERFSEDISKLMRQLDAETSANPKITTIVFKKDFSLKFVETMIEVFKTELQEHERYLKLDSNHAEVSEFIRKNLREFEIYQKTIEDKNKIYIQKFDPKIRALDNKENSVVKDTSIDQLIKDTEAELKAEKDETAKKQLQDKLSQLKKDNEINKNASLSDAEKNARVRIVRVSEEYYSFDQLNNQWEMNIIAASKDNKLLPTYKEEMLTTLENRINKDYWKEFQTNLIQKVDYFDMFSEPEGEESEEIKSYRMSIADLEEKIAKNREKIRSDKNQLEILQKQRGALSNLSIQNGFQGLPEEEQKLRIKISEQEIENIKVAKQLLEYEKLLNETNQTSSAIQNVFQFNKPQETPEALLTAQNYSMSDIRVQQAKLDQSIELSSQIIKQHGDLENQLQANKEKIVNAMNIGAGFLTRFGRGFSIEENWAQDLENTVLKETWWKENAYSPNDETFKKAKDNIVNDITLNLQKYTLLDASKRILKEIKIESTKTKARAVEINAELEKAQSIEQDSVKKLTLEEIQAKQDFLYKDLKKLNEKSKQLLDDLSDL